MVREPHRETMPEQANRTQRLAAFIGGLARTARGRSALAAAAAAAIALALTPGLFRSLPRYQVGDYHVGAYRAPFAVSVVDDQATAQARVAAAAEVPPVYDYDEAAARTVAVRVAEVFRKTNAVCLAAGQAEPRRAAPRRSGREPAAAASCDLDAEQQRALAEALQVNLSAEEATALAAAGFAPSLAVRLGSLLLNLYSHYVAADAADLQRRLVGPDGRSVPLRLTVRDRDRAQTVTLESADRLLDVPQAAAWIGDRAPAAFADLPPALQSALTAIARAQVRPNLVLAAAATDEARRQAAAAVLPVQYAFERNQLIIGDGQQVTRQTVVVLDELRRRTAPRGWATIFVGLAALVFAVVAISFRLSDDEMPQVEVADRDALMIGFLLVVTVAALRLTSWFGERLGALFPGDPQRALYLLFPIAAPAMLVRSLTRFEIALIFSTVLALLSALAIDATPPVAAAMFVAMLVGAATIGEATTRARVGRAGVLAGLTAAALALALALIEQDLTVAALAHRPLAALAGGILAGMVTVGAAPLFEWAFGYMTDISLLELANYEQPLLKDLARVAPGTFHHSIALGTLAEEACDAVGADPLLARVGALHHDVGKMLNARYFVENQHGENPHDRAPTPEESARLVISHVVDGARLARAHRLPQPVIDFIEQHHGTRAVTYFLERARELRRETGRTFDEAAFRYPGPKPQTKETAILMICDVLEARARTMDDREPAAVERMARDVIAGLRDEGQLDECPLTVGDLAKLPGPLAAVLLGMRHERIKYPDQQPARPGRKKRKRR